jgi:hypothetical protein
MVAPLMRVVGEKLTRVPEVQSRPHLPVEQELDAVNSPDWVSGGYDVTPYFFKGIKL